MRDKITAIVGITIGVLLVFVFLIEPICVCSLPKELPHEEVFCDGDVKVTAHLSNNGLAYFVKDGLYGAVLKGRSLKRYKDFLVETESNLSNLPNIAEVKHKGTIKVLCTKKRISLWRKAESAIAIDDKGNPTLIIHFYAFTTQIIQFFHSADDLDAYYNAFNDESVYETLKILDGLT